MCLSECGLVARGAVLTHVKNGITDARVTLPGWVQDAGLSLKANKPDWSSLHVLSESFHRTASIARGSLTCTHFHGEFDAGHLLCEGQRPAGVAGAALGYAFWEREPGPDDE
jgi:hypothetical protein